MDSKLVQKIVLVGDDCNVFVAALLLRKNLQQYGVKITCIKLPENKETCPTECVGAELSAVFSIIGANEFDAVRAGQGVFSYGTRYQVGDKRWFCPYGQYGLVTAENEFEQGLFRYLSGHAESKLDDYSLAAVAAGNTKFAVAGDRKPELRSALEFGAIVDAGLYKEYLKNLAAKFEVAVVECSSVDVVRAGNHKIKEIVLDKDTVVDADFWFDCSGDRACLAVGLDAYKKLWPKRELKHDRIAYFLVDEVAELDEPFSTMHLSEVGLLKKTPLRNQIWYQLHFDSSLLDEDGIKRFMERSHGDRVSHQFTEKPRLGFLLDPWLNNCLFVGHSGCNLGRIAIPEATLVQEAVVRFLDVYPARISLDASARSYNANWQRVINEAVDYTVLHSLLLPQGFEDKFSEQEFSDTLQKRINLFKRLGRLPASETDIVRDQQWYAMLFGIGLRPELHSVMISSLTDQEIEETMSKLGGLIKQIVRTMPTNREFLNKRCS